MSCSQPPGKVVADPAMRAAAIFIAAVSILVVGIQPVFIGLLAGHLGLSLAQQGWMISVEMCGSVFGTLLVAPLARRWGSRWLCAMAAFALGGLTLLTGLAEQYTTMLLLRCLAGVVAGGLYAQAVYLLGRMPGQDRSYGFLLLLQTSIFAVMAAALPLLAATLGFMAAMCMLAAWYVLACLACRLLPRQVGNEAGQQTPSSEVGPASFGVAALAGMLCLQVAIYAVWGFIDGIAGGDGLSAVAVGWAVGIGLLGGLPGAALPSLLGNRFGRLPMILLGSFCVALAVWLLGLGVKSGEQLAGVVFLMNFGWVLALSYYMAAVVSHDASGRLTRLVSVVQVTSAAFAPTVLSLFLGDGGKTLIFSFSVGSVLLGCLLAALVGLGVGRRQQLRAALS